MGSKGPRPFAGRGQSPRLIVALDVADVAMAQNLCKAVAGSCGLVKLGLEYFLAHGPPGVRAMTDRPIFLDLKLHDIPNTVAGAVRSVLPLAPAMLTLHASGGAAMIAAARDAAGAQGPLLLAVTVLTSLDQATLAATGVAGGLAAQVARLGRLAMAAGADGLVCSPLEIAVLRDALGEAPVLVVPGVRPSDWPGDDQVRVMTPRAAIDAGADWIVVGRPITRAADPGAAAASIAAEIA